MKLQIVRPTNWRSHVVTVWLVRQTVELVWHDGRNIKGLTKITSKQLYNGLSPVSDTIQARRLRLAGHTFRDESSPAHHTVTWDPSHGTLSRGRPTQTFVNTLLNDTGLDNITELECCMKDKINWRSRVSRCHTSGWHRMDWVSEWCCVRLEN